MHAGAEEMLQECRSKMLLGPPFSRRNQGVDALGLSELTCKSQYIPWFELSACNQAPSSSTGGPGRLG